MGPGILQERLCEGRGVRKGGCGRMLGWPLQEGVVQGLLEGLHPLPRRWLPVFPGTAKEMACEGERRHCSPGLSVVFCGATSYTDAPVLPLSQSRAPPISLLLAESAALMELMSANFETVLEITLKSHKNAQFY